MDPKSEHLIDLIFNKLKTYKRKKIFLERENRYELAQKCFETVSVHADLDILKFSNIFEH